MYKAIHVKYMPPTARRGSRLQAECGGSLSGKQRISIPYPHDVRRDRMHWEAAKALIVKMGWQDRMQGCWAAGGMADQSTAFVYTDLPREHAVNDYTDTLYTTTEREPVK